MTLLLAWVPRVSAQLAIRGEIIHTMAGEPIRDGVVLVRDGRILLATFHPELTDDLRVHELFLDMVTEEQLVRA